MHQATSHLRQDINLHSLRTSATAQLPCMCLWLLSFYKVISFKEYSFSFINRLFAEFITLNKEIFISEPSFVSANNACSNYLVSFLPAIINLDLHFTQSLSSQFCMWLPLYVLASYIFSDFYSFYASVRQRFFHCLRQFPSVE